MSKTRKTNSVRAQIYGREYVLRSNGDPDHLRALCAVLDERMRKVAAETGSVDTLKAAVLAALSIADDAHRAREETKKLDDAIGNRSIACISILDNDLS